MALHAPVDDRLHLVVAAGTDDRVGRVGAVALPHQEQVGRRLAAGAQHAGVVVGQHVVRADERVELGHQRGVERVAQPHVGEVDGGGVRGADEGVDECRGRTPASGPACSGSPQRDQCISRLICYSVTYDVTSSQHPRDDLPDTDTAILDAARESILAVGWRRSTLTDVARRAGVSRMTLYRRWPDMQGLLGELMTREWTAAMAAVAEGNDPGSSMLAQVRRGVVLTARAIRDDALFAKIVDVDPELLLPYLLDRRGRSQQLVLTLLEPMIRQGQRRKEIRKGDPVMLARTLLLAAQGFTLSVQTMTDPRSEQGLTERDFEDELGLLVQRYLAP